MLLDACSKLQSNVDVKMIFILLMLKLAKYVENAKDEKGIPDSTQKIFNKVKGNINKIMNKKNSSYYIRLLSKNKNDIVSNDTIKLIGKLLGVPFESNMSIFSMSNFSELMRHLEYESRSTLSLRTIDSLVNSKASVKLDNSERISVLMDFIRPLLEDSPDAGEYDQYQFEYEQASVCKLLFDIQTPDPQNIYNILNIMKNTFIKGDTKREKFTLVALINAYILLAYKISYALDKLNGGNDTREEKIHEDFINYYNLKSLDSNEQIHKFMRRIYSQINDTLSLMENDFAEHALKL